MTVRVLVAGAGRVGSAIYRLNREAGHHVYLVDKEVKYNSPPSVDVLHICFPYFEGFEMEVVSYGERCDAGLTLIESTVPVGTTREIYNMLNGTRLICHSPVRGCHDSLFRDLKRYDKFIGSSSVRARYEAVVHYMSLGLEVYTCVSFEETEFLKLAGLSSFAVNIAFWQELMRKAKVYGVPKALIGYWFNDTENASGYTVERPVLDAGVIGGSCVMQGLEKLFGASEMVLWICGSNEKRKQEDSG